MNKNLIIDSLGSSEIIELQKYKQDDIGNIFLFFRNIYDSKGNIEKSFLELVKEYSDLYDFLTYKNIIIVPDEKNYRSNFNDNLLYILWFTINDNAYFNKDIIREPHIWKNVEWGKREKNYSPNGKDPSNVWIPTEDDGKGKITNHIAIKLEGAIERIGSAFSSTIENNQWIYTKGGEHFEESLENIKLLLRESSNNFLFTYHTAIYKESEVINQTQNIKGEILFESSEKISVNSDSANLVVTSPPYWNLKDYFKDGQIGQESYDNYLFRLNEVWKESIRLLKPNSTIWININIRTHKKKPYFLPTEFILQMKKLGMIFKEVFIWHKSSSIPTGNKNLSDKFEVFLVFSNDVNLTKQNILFDEYKNDFIKGGTIWNINRKAGSVGKKFIHPAIYPTELIERVIKISTNMNETVLDPFLGSGTTAIAAFNTYRNCIGVEYNEEFEELIKYRLIKETNLEKENFVEADKSLKYLF